MEGSGGGRGPTCGSCRADLAAKVLLCALRSSHREAVDLTAL